MDHNIMTLFQSFDMGDMLTSFSILIATALGIMTVMQNRKISRRSHTLDILLSRFADGNMASHLNKLREIEDAGNPPDGNEKIRELGEALNLYEFISAAARQDILDVELIYETRGGAMMSTLDFFMPYIKKRREIQGNPRLWEHYEWFVEKKVRPRRK